ncbi:vomeronasal type-2 receptor 26-like [Hyperolius riggenbachi]|uniref:vomeronasal type-2 receptor 26-like n=1 Tax=Hyperolius riggenbachi TaxID=752182 RepID=UPI0035A31F9D
MTLDSYIKDTGMFLQKIGGLDVGGDDLLLVTFDVESLYTSIPHDGGVEAIDWFLMTRSDLSHDQRLFVLELLNVVLRLNYFTFQGDFFLQLRGTAMGSNVAPSYANLYMGLFEEAFVYSNCLYQRYAKCWYRFIDDIFCVWAGPRSALDQFLIDLSQCCREIRLTSHVSNDQMYHQLKLIRHLFESNKRMPLFNEQGEFVYHYRISNVIHENERSATVKTVGVFIPWASEDQQLHINRTAIGWKFTTKPPVSRCSDPCLPGSRKKLGSSMHICCYECVLCPDGHISNTTDSEDCMKCPEDEWPNERKDLCVPKLVEFLSYTEDPITSVFLSVSALCCLLAGLILWIFVLHQDTPIVKANNRSLSYLLLVSIMLSFLCVFLFLGRPSNITCRLRVTSFGVIFSVAISSLLAKSIMVFIAFKATKPGSFWKTWLGAKLSNSIISVCSLVQIIICVTWLSTCPPFQEQDLHSFQDIIVTQCNEGSVIGFYSVLGYMGILASISFIIAFIARTLPDRFNEAKYITFSMLVFCSVWIAMIPAYLSTRGKYMVAVQVFAIMTSSAGLLVCIFFPKCYIILRRPELNTKRGLLENRDK